MGLHNKELGRRGEDAAARWYLESGYDILDRNWRRREGELDLVVGRDDMVVFVEVKTRSSDRYGSGFHAVNRVKQQRIRRLAADWLAERRRSGRGAAGGFVSDIRFDVADVDQRGHLRVREGCF